MKKPASRRLAFLGIVIAVVALVLWLSPDKGGSTAVDVSKLRTEAARVGDLPYQVTATGTIEPLRRYEIKSLASGTVISMPVETGSRVNRGELICQIDPQEGKNNLEKAESALEVARLGLEKAEADLRRQTELFKNKYISESALEDFRLAVAKSRADHVNARVNRDNAQKQYRDTRVVAPISGTILLKDVDVGQVISSGTSSVSGGTRIAEMADLASVYIKALVDESDIARIKRGQRARISVEAYGDERFSGEVYKVEPTATMEQNVTSFLVTVSIANRDARLKPGMNATVQITTETLTNLLLVPHGAVRKSGRLNVVFVVRDGKVVPQRVKAGRTNYERIEISEGLAAGDRVVVSGLSGEEAESLLAAMAAARGERGPGGGRPPGAGVVPGAGGGGRRGMR